MTDDHDRPDAPRTWGRAGERPGAPRAADKPAATTAHAVSSWVDQQIQQAQRQGAFDDLRGAGKPLPDVDTRTDPDWWVRSLIEREQLDLSAAMPGVMQLRREKAGFPDSLLDLPDEAAVRARLEDFNERVLADRRRPHAGAGSPPVVGRVDVEEMLEVWRAARPATPSPEQGAAGEETPGGTPPAPPRRPWWRRSRQG